MDPILERYQALEKKIQSYNPNADLTREEFEAVWRYLKQHASPSVLEDNPGRLAKNIARSYHLRETFVRTMVCLQVFDERGLIRVERRSPGQLQIGLRPVEGKVDLEQSALMRRLRALMES